MEASFLDALRQESAGPVSAAPTQADAFVRWFEGLARGGPGQADPLHPWLATEGSRDDLRWFIAQELSGEAGFADVLALTQVGMPAEIKLEMAANYWDEMGRGRQRGMHDPMLGPLAHALNIQPSTRPEALPEALAVGNLMVGLAWNRPWVWHSVGALGVVELTAPDRCVHVVRALLRHGLSREEARYYRVHATVDRRHSRDWNEGVLRRAVVADPRRARWIAEGAWMRLLVGARSYQAYRAHLMGGAPV